MTRAPRARSVRTEIVVGFVTVILAFGAVATYSLVRQQRAVASMRLANEGYLRLAVQLNRASANQGLFNTLLDRLLDERDPVNSRTWLALARRSRRGVLSAALGLVRESARGPLDPDDARLLRRAAVALAEIDAVYAADEALFEEMFQALASGTRPVAEALKRSLLVRESGCEDRLRRAMLDVQARMGRLADGVERQQRQSLRLTLAAIAVACVLGAASTLNAQRALRPLARLRDRARAVARGDLGPAELVGARPDEIGELANEFERMVGAVAARDAALRKANAEVLQAERLAAIGRMAAHVTHEVRNPLSSMALNAEMLGDEVAELGERGAEPLRLVRAIQREIDRLTGITEEYLRVARLPRPRLEREEPGAVVADAVTFVQREMETAGVALRLSVAPGVPAVLLDEGQIRQALLNLLRNAREAMEAARTEAPSLVVRVAPARGGVEVAVSDAGPGLTEEALSRLFELFFTTKQSGSGLGLPLTREIVAAHGGTIRAERAEAADGGGARFVIWLPGATT